MRAEEGPPRTAVGRHSDLGLDAADFKGATRTEMVAALQDVIEDEADAQAEAMDPGGWDMDDDSGFGPFSYFAHAMPKDD